MTSKQYWESLHFDYVETYSLLRETEGDNFYKQTQEKAGKEPHAYNKQKALLHIGAHGSIAMLEEKGIFHPTAIKTNTFTKNSQELKLLEEIVTIEYDQHTGWMCSPIFRDAIVFYQAGKIISCLHICLSCEQIETEGKGTVDTASKAFLKLKDFFKRMGHKAEDD